MYDIRTFCANVSSHLQHIQTSRPTMASRVAAAVAFVLLALLGSAHASLNGFCSIGSTPGVCIHTADCTSKGGTYRSNYCPQDPADVKCCTKTPCVSGPNVILSHCVWSNKPYPYGCSSGYTAAGHCPGPANFLCCLELKSDTPRP